MPIVVEPPGGQIPGDANQDVRIDLSDAIQMLRIQFFGDSAPCSDEAGNLSLLDFNGDGVRDQSDATGLLSYLFLGEAPHVLGIDCVSIAGCAVLCEP